MRRTDLFDTTPWAHKVHLELLRKLTPAEKIRRVWALSSQLKRIREAGAAYGAQWNTTTPSDKS
jgi:hypothetical protein